VLAFLGRDKKGTYETVGLRCTTPCPELPEVGLFRLGQMRDGINGYFPHGVQCLR
jgi:hypothetical protein